MTHPLMPARLPEFQLDAALTLTQVAQRIRAPHGGRLNVGVVWRWATSGYTCRGWTGPKLIMPTIIIGSRRYIMPDWLKLFEQARVRMGERVAAPRAQKQKPSADHKRAQANLRRAGIAC